MRVAGTTTDVLVGVTFVIVAIWAEAGMSLLQRRWPLHIPADDPQPQPEPAVERITDLNIEILHALLINDQWRCKQPACIQCQLANDTTRQLP